MAVTHLDREGERSFLSFSLLKGIEVPVAFEVAEGIVELNDAKRPGAFSKHPFTCLRGCLVAFLYFQNYVCYQLSLIILFGHLRNRKACLCSVLRGLVWM